MRSRLHILLLILLYAHIRVYAETSVTIAVPSRVCIDDVVVLKSDFSNDGSMMEPVYYQWYFSDDQTNWIAVPGATQAEWRINKVASNYTGWYRLTVYNMFYDAGTTEITSEAKYMDVIQCDTPRPELCMDGVLLFREDFGGNDPDDPVAGTDRVPGMSNAYRQIYDTANCAGKPDDCVGMGSGRYLVTKVGYRNAAGFNWSHWFIMDDHTYPGDYTRGYLLEIDGRGSGQDVFYQTTLDHLCEGTKLTFSAYVANVSTTASYKQGNVGCPKLTFTITHPLTGETLATHVTDTIGHDWMYAGTKDEWRNSAHWQLVGMNFVVPPGIDAVLLSISNTPDAASGNDFAMDDIEVHACFPPASILSDSVICKDSRNRFELDFTNDGSLVEPVVYQWFFTRDTADGWTEIIGADDEAYTPHFTAIHTGWYRAAISGAGNTASTTCSSWSEPFFLRIDSTCVDLCEQGTLIHCDHPEQSRMTNRKYERTIEQLCAGTDLSFLAYIANSDVPDYYSTRPWLYVYPHLTFRVFDAIQDTVLVTRQTNNIPVGTAWQTMGTKLTIPEGVETLRLEIEQNSDASNDVSVRDVELRLCMPVPAISGEPLACRKKEQVYQVTFKNDGSVTDPEYQWSFSADSTSWTVLQTASSTIYSIDSVHKYHEGWYRVSVASSGNSDFANCRTFSEPVRLNTYRCLPAAELTIDTTACDTLLPISWRGHRWLADSIVTDTLYDIDDDDSLYIHLDFRKKICCPMIETHRVDSAICDTLLPFIWFFRDTMVQFTDIGSQRIEFAHHKWTHCTGEIVTLALDTFHCERLYPIIVNKYNWQLLLDHVTLRRFFPDHQPLSYQWYCDSVAIPGATEDDYSEQNELHGAFQLFVQLDGDAHAWSQILRINEVPDRSTVTKHIYNSQGYLIREEDMQHGIFLIRYQQGNNIWTEKRYIP